MPSAATAPAPLRWRPWQRKRPCVTKRPNKISVHMINFDDRWAYVAMAQVHNTLDHNQTVT